MKELSVLSAKFRAFAAILLTILLGGAGYSAYELRQVHAIRKAHEVETAVRLALQESGRAGDVRRFGVQVYDPKHPKFGATGDNPAGWKIDPTTGDLVAPSGKVIEGLSQKQAVAGTCTTNVASLSGTATTCDGVTFAANQRALLTNQTTATQIGCWVAASGAWTRCPDFAAGASGSGAFFVSGGSTNKGVWLVTNAAGSDVVGTNTLTLLNVAGGGGGGAVSSVFTRTGAVTAQSGDYTFSQLGAATGAVTFSSGTLQQLIGISNSPGSTAAVNARYTEEPRNWTHLSYGSDFDKCSGTQSTSVYCDGMIASVAGTSASAAIFASGAVDDNQIGVIELTTGSTSTGIAAILSSVNGTSGGTLQAKTSARLVFDCRGRVPTLSNGTQAFNSYCGWLDAGSPTNGAWFSNDSNANTHWMMNVGATQTATTVTVTAGQYYHLVGIKQAGGDCVDFFIDGVQTGTCVGTIATSTNLFLGAVAKSSVGGTTKNFDLDWVRGSLVYQRAN